MTWFIFSRQKQVEDLKKERKTVEDQMAMAEDELQKTEDSLKMLQESKSVRLTKLHVLHLSYTLTLIILTHVYIY